MVPESFTAKTLKVSIQTYDQKKAQHLVQTIDSIYEIYTREAKNQALEQKINFLDDRIAATEKILQDYEGYFEQFTIDNRSTNLGTDLSKTIAQLESLDTAHFNLRTRKSDVEVLKSQLTSDQPLLLNDIFVDRFPSSVSTLLSEYQKSVNNRSIKLTSYSESTFIIQQLNEEIGQLRAQLLALVNAYQEDVENQLERIVSRKSLLENSLNQLPALETEYTKNRRFYGQQEEFMLGLRQAKMEIEITRAGTVTDIVVLSPASYPSYPVTPQKFLNLWAWRDGRFDG